MTGTNGATTTTISDKWLQATQLCVASGPLSASSQHGIIHVEIYGAAT
jgi:hypothetical protein